MWLDHAPPEGRKCCHLDSPHIPQQAIPLNCTRCYSANRYYHARIQLVTSNVHVWEKYLVKHNTCVCLQLYHCYCSGSVVIHCLKDIKKFISRTLAAVYWKSRYFKCRYSRYFCGDNWNAPCNERYRVCVKYAHTIIFFSFRPKCHIKHSQNTDACPRMWIYSSC